MERSEELIEINNTTSSRMKAFKSGVGDGLDCFISKGDRQDINSFKFINNVYGIKANSDGKYNSINFKYRYKVTGDFKELSFLGSFKVSIVATEIEEFFGDFASGSVTRSGELEYSFSKDVNVVNLKFDNIFSEPLKENKRYQFEVRIRDAIGDLKVYSFSKGVSNITGSSNFTIRGYSDTEITVVASPVEVTSVYEDVYPSLEHDAITGYVNGDFESSVDGYKEFKTTAHTFDIPEWVDNKKYFCIIEYISNSNTAYVKQRFDGEVESDIYTEINGDSITFSSKAITPNSKEHRELVYQELTGIYTSKNNTSTDIEYSFKISSVEYEWYKRYELSLSCDNNEVFVTNYDYKILIEGDYLKIVVNATVRNMQQATSKWNPSIHTGFFYYNQDEKYLYSKCIMNGENSSTSQTYLKKNISVKLIVDVGEAKSERKLFINNFKSKDELLLDKEKYLWRDGMITPKPKSYNNGYYEFYNNRYETEPIVFEHESMAINSVTWSELCSSSCKVVPYIVSFNNKIGEWNEPVLIESDTPPVYELSSIIKIRFDLISKSPVLIQDTLKLNSESKWLDSISKHLSYNLDFTYESIKLKSNQSKGVFISKIVDLGDIQSDTKLRSVKGSFKKSGDIKFFIQESNIKSDLEVVNNSTWKEVNVDSLIKNVSRFFIFKIELLPESKVYSLEIVLNRYKHEGSLSDNVPSIGDITVTSSQGFGSYASRYETVINKSVKCNSEKEKIINNLAYELNKMSILYNFNVNNVVNYSVIPYGANSSSIDVYYNKEVANNEPVHVKTKTKEYDYLALEKSVDGVVFDISENKTIKSTPIPRAFAPIIIKKEYDNFIPLHRYEEETLKEVAFLDEEVNCFSLTNKESFISIGFKTYYLQFKNIDLSSVVAYKDDEMATDYIVKDNVIIFDSPVSKGSLVKVEYKLKDSFCVNYNFQDNEVIIDFNIPNDLKKVRVFYETSKTPSKLLENISLNPIYNGVNSGYIYISDRVEQPTYMDIYAEKQTIQANGLNFMTVIISLKDKYKNPVEGAIVNTICAFGRIEPEYSNKTDQNGSVKYIYTSSNLNCIDTIKSIYSYDVKNEIVILNKKA